MGWRLLPLAVACAGSAAAGELSIGGHGGGSYEVPVTSLKGLRFTSTLRQQLDFSCGSAAVATLLRHQYGLGIDERSVFDRMYALADQAKIRREGFSLLDIKRFLQSQGFEADGFEVPLEKLAEEGVPAIALINENGYNHFVVVKGLRDGRVLLGDPSSGTRSLPRSRFDAVWQQRILFVVHNQPGRGRFNSTEDWRLAPAAPLAAGVNREPLATLTLPRRGPGEF
jgi:predicted double-glycine peptidase